MPKYVKYANSVLAPHFSDSNNFNNSSWEKMLVHGCQILGLMMHLIFGVPRWPTAILMNGFRNIVRLSLKGAG